jgi:hypothetical protein
MRRTMYVPILFLALLAVLFSQRGNSQGAATEDSLKSLEPQPGTHQAFDESQQDDSLSCKILPTTTAWNPPGTMDVSVDDTNVGSFTFGPNGSTGFDFKCTAGKHSFTLAIENTNVSCSASFTISKDKTSFSPGLRVAPSGSMICALQ